MLIASENLFDFERRAFSEPDGRGKNFLLFSHFLTFFKIIFVKILKQAPFGEKRPDAARTPPGRYIAVVGHHVGLVYRYTYSSNAINSSHLFQNGQVVPRAPQMV